MGVGMNSLEPMWRTDLGQGVQGGGWRSSLQETERNMRWKSPLEWRMKAYRSECRVEWCSPGSQEVLGFQPRGTIPQLCDLGKFTILL